MADAPRRTQPVLARTLQCFCLLFAIFALHRGLTAPPLASQQDLTRSGFIEALLVGLMSDFWVAILGALFMFLISLASAFLGLRRLAAFLPWAFFGAFAFALAAHQSYVEFFRFQFMPFHLQYLTDLDFIKANGSSVFTWRSAATLAFALAAGVTLARLKYLETLSTANLAASCVTLLLLGLGLHNRNIHYRVQWFIPENMQLNVVENFYIAATKARTPPELTDDEARFLAKELGYSGEHLPADDAAKLFALVTKAPPVDDDMDTMGKTLRSQFLDAAVNGRRPMLAVILMESLRPSETGYFVAGSQPSLTPHLDTLAQQGIAFMRAYATGSVTRGGQEAVFCGYLGSRDTSLMRGHNSLNFTCLFDYLTKHEFQQGGVESFWFHGGEGRFDSQLNFWRHRSVKHLLSLSDFPPDIPRTGWGVGDVSFLHTAADKLADIKARSNAAALMGMLLTVSHHIPWTLPADAPQSLPHALASRHPSYLTTAYADIALGKFVEKLRVNGMWDDTLLIIASDHGNSIPPYAELYGDQETRSEYLQSHINLVLSGGLTEQLVINQHHGGGLKIDTPVSQAGIASFIAYILGLSDARVMAESLFAKTSSIPVLSDLELGLFSPVLNRKFSRRELLESNAAALPRSERTSLLYYRAFLELLTSFAQKP